MPGHGMGDVYQEMREEIAGLKDENDRIARGFLERTGERDEAIIRAEQAESELERLRVGIADLHEKAHRAASVATEPFVRQTLGYIAVACTALLDGSQEADPD